MDTSAVIFAIGAFAFALVGVIALVAALLASITDYKRQRQEGVELEQIFKTKCTELRARSAKLQATIDAFERKYGKEKL